MRLILNVVNDSDCVAHIKRFRLVGGLSAGTLVLVVIFLDKRDKRLYKV